MQDETPVVAHSCTKSSAMDAYCYRTFALCRRDDPTVFLGILLAE